MSQADPPAFCPFPKGQAAVHTLLLSHTNARPWQMTAMFAGESLFHACLTFANPTLQNDLSSGNSSEQCSSPDRSGLGSVAFFHGTHSQQGDQSRD